jgi:glycosyltransferase involved in cell wall biosynthesis
VVVAPLRFGAGIKGKVLEALQHQVPVVTTSIGAEGLPEPRASYLAIADDAHRFAQEVVVLYSSEERWVERAERGRDVINRHFSRESAYSAVSRDLQLGIT